MDASGRVLAKVVVTMAEPGDYGHPVSGLTLLVASEGGDRVSIHTDDSGVASAWLARGSYRFVNPDALAWKGSLYTWDIVVDIKPGTGAIKLTRENATKVVSSSTTQKGSVIYAAPVITPNRRAEGTPANRQVSALQVGVEGGASIASLVGSFGVSATSRTSPYIGGTLAVQPGGSTVGFQSGLLYVPKGATASIAGGRYALSINYLEIPLLVRLALPLQGSELLPVLLFGGSAGVKTSCNVTAQSGTATSSIDCGDSTFGGEFDLKTIDWGLSAGAMLDIPAGKGLIVAPVIRYTRGIAVIGNTSNNADATNSVFQIGLGLRMR